MHKGNLIICAGSPDGTLDDIAEFVSNEHFGHDLPSQLVEDSAAWFDLKDLAIYFYPRGQVLDFSCVGWKLKLKSDGAYSMKHRDGTNLHSINGTTGKQYARHLLAIERPGGILVTSRKEQYVVELKRFSFSFVAKVSGHLNCREWSATIDPDQRLGTFAGLKNYLLLLSSETYLGSPIRSIPVLARLIRGNEKILFLVYFDVTLILSEKERKTSVVQEDLDQRISL